MGATNTIQTNVAGNAISGIHNGVSGYFTGNANKDTLNASAIALGKGGPESYKIKNTRPDAFGPINPNASRGARETFNKMKSSALKFITNNKKTVGGVAGILGAMGMYSALSDD